MSWSRNAPRAALAAPQFTQLAFIERKPRVGRVYHPYSDWEEYHFGMWSDISATKRAALLPAAVAFMADTDRYGAAMLRVVDEWPISCEHNLTCQGMNRQAWIGHAACALELGAPESLTREAWHHLTDRQRDTANTAADHAITTWECAYVLRA
jgi:hypothetical protein